MLRKLFCSQVTWKVAKVVDGDEREREVYYGGVAVGDYGLLDRGSGWGWWMVGTWEAILQQHATNQKSSPSLFPRFQFILTHTYGYSGV